MPGENISETMLMSEDSLDRDWDLPEEDTAWLSLESLSDCVQGGGVNA